MPEPLAAKPAVPAIEPAKGIDWQAAPHTLHMNKYQFLYVLQRVLEAFGRVEAQRITADSVVGPLGILLAVVLALVTADFKNALGVPQGAWEGMFLLAALVAAIWTIYKFLEWRRYVNQKVVLKTAEQWYHEVVLEIQKDEAEAVAGVGELPKP
jgi:hypothetical protein